jgi:hypothetical protein
MTSMFTKMYVSLIVCILTHPTDERKIKDRPESLPVHGQEIFQTANA